MYRFLTFLQHGLLYRCWIQYIALNHLQISVLDVDSRGIACKRGDHVSLLKGLLDKLTAYAAC